MIRTTSTTLLAACTLLAMASFVLLGCQPVEKKAASELEDKTSTNDSAVSPKVDSADASSEETTTASDETDTAGNASVNGTTTSGTISGELAEVDWDSLVGEEISVEGDLVVVDTYDLSRRGQIVVARERLYVPTSKIDPNDIDPTETSFEGGGNVGKVVGAQKFNDQATITLDDGSSKQNIFPPSLFPTLGKDQPTLRVGSVVSGVSGKLIKERNKVLLVPNKPLDWKPAPRPNRPDVGDADVTVASFNVLNYFTTIDDGSNQARGADSMSELERQEAKIVAAIIALQADVVGLMELENNLAAEKRLVAALNKKIGKEAFKGCGLPDGFDSAPGGQNAIRVGIIYRSDRVRPDGAIAMINDDAFDGARTPLVQSFLSTKSEKTFSVIVNHFKSKGGSNRADAANKNKGDGQGAYNATRRAQSLAICKHIDDRMQNDGKSRVLVIGDLNAYGEEDPIDAMRANGLVDLRQQFKKETSTNGEGHYSYIYRGQSGSLDHAMATASLAKDVTGIATWHINADEPRSLDYNEEYNPKSLYKANPFRSSDHDPVIIGIRN